MDKNTKRIDAIDDEMIDALLTLISVSAEIIQMINERKEIRNNELHDKCRTCKTIR